jgi:hypothetical protein
MRSFQIFEILLCDRLVECLHVVVSCVHTAVLKDIDDGHLGCKRVVGRDEVDVSSLSRDTHSHTSISCFQFLLQKKLVSIASGFVVARHSGDVCRGLFPDKCAAGGSQWQYPLGRKMWTLPTRA